MATTTIRVNDTPIRVSIGPDAEEASRQRALAQQALADTVAAGTAKVAQAEAARDASIAASLAAVPRVGLEGDSIMAQNHDRVGVEFIATSGLGELIWARSLFPHFEMDQWEDPADALHSSKGCNVAVGGHSTSQVIAQMEEVAKIAPDILCLAIGINDINGGNTAAFPMGNIKTICEYYTGLGIRVLLANLRPVGAGYALTDWSDGSTRLAELLALNALIEDYAAITPNVVLVDLMAAYSNGATPPRPRAGETYDELHPNRTGAFWGGVLGWLPALRKVIKPLVIARPTGANIVTDGNFAGTGGIAATGFTGDVATNWLLECYANGGLGAGFGAVASKNAADQQVVTITPGGKSWELVQVNRAFGGALMQEGKWYKGLFRIRLSASAYWRAVSFQYSIHSQAMSGVDFTTAYIGDTGEDLELLIETPHYQAPSGGEIGVTLAYIFTDGASPDPMQFTILEAYAAEVADPNPLHGFTIPDFARP
jgi:lysophospholipase L1-like esterase